MTDLKRAEKSVTRDVPRVEVVYSNSYKTSIVKGYRKHTRFVSPSSESWDQFQCLRHLKKVTSSCFSKFHRNGMCLEPRFNVCQTLSA